MFDACAVLGCVGASVAPGAVRPTLAIEAAFHGSVKLRPARSTAIGDHGASDQITCAHAGTGAGAGDSGEIASFTNQLSMRCSCPDGRDAADGGQSAGGGYHTRERTAKRDDTGCVSACSRGCKFAEQLKSRSGFCSRAIQPISAVWLAFVASVSRGNHRRTYASGS
jgi:hypothetical protein